MAWGWHQKRDGAKRKWLGQDFNSIPKDTHEKQSREPALRCTVGAGQSRFCIAPVRWMKLLSTTHVTPPLNGIRPNAHATGTAVYTDTTDASQFDTKSLLAPFWTRTSIANMINAKIARGMQWGLSRSMATDLSALRTPEHIQDFVNAIPWNFEAHGWTALSVAEVLKHRHAHCIEGAFVSACALGINGMPPLLMDMGAANGDVDHIVALFRRGRYWGAISKSNSPFLRYRDPIYRTLRELAISYFPYYFKLRRKTLRTYSIPIDLRRYGPALWVTKQGFCQELVDALTAARHFQILPSGMSVRLRPIDLIEARSGQLQDYAPDHTRSTLGGAGGG